MKRKVIFFAPYEDLMAYGVRILSAYLKKEGFLTEIIFDPGFLSRNDSRSMAFLADRIKEMATDSYFVGLSFFSCHLNAVKQLTQTLRQGLQVPIVWGGKHISIKPEDAVGYADIVAIGEAELAIRDLLHAMENNEKLTDIRGLWFIENTKIKKNPPASIIQDLDQLPVPDYSRETQYLWDGVSMNAMTVERFYAHSKINGRIVYQTLASRGCLYNCTYCSTFKHLYPKKSYLRIRSPEHVIGEIKAVLLDYPGIQAILLSDDNFFAMKNRQLDIFAELYKKNIGLPFRCLAHSHDINDRKLRTLIDAGMIELQVGIQTGSERTRKIYRRGPSTAKVMESVRLIHQYENFLKPVYDFIVDNPFEDDNDLVQTLQMIQHFPRPFHLNIFSLSLLPGTQLYRMAEEKGLVFDETKQFESTRKTYINFVFSLFNHMPRWVMAILISRPMLAIMKNKAVVCMLYFLKTGIRKAVRFLAPFKRSKVAFLLFRMKY